MIYQVLKLKSFFDSEYIGEDAILTIYAIDNSPEFDMNKKRPTVLICPGGGYGMTSDREAEPVALRFLRHGFNAAVLRYSCAPAHYPAQLIEVSAAMALLKRRAEYNIDRDKIAICGFSAGGHLAASLGVLWKEPIVSAELKLSSGENRPHAMILSYPVISSGEFSHNGSFQNLLGKSPEPALLAKLSLENEVCTDTCPAFIWHTANDDVVPAENALLFAAALKKAAVPFELHIYDRGPHGLSLADDSVPICKNMEEHRHIRSWFDLAIEWLNRM